MTETATFTSCDTHELTAPLEDTMSDTTTEKSAAATSRDVPRCESVKDGRRCYDVPGHVEKYGGSHWAALLPAASWTDDE
jgi:hypothetical protein